MTRYLLVLSLLLPATASAQWTAAKKNGIVKAAIDAVAWVKAGGTPTIVGGTQVRFGGTVPVGTNCARCTVYLDDDDLTFLGLNPQAAILQGPANRYAVMQVCGDAVASPTYDVPRWLAELVDTCSTIPYTATGVWPKVIIAHRTDAAAQAAATGFACACSTGASCNWTPPLPGGGYGASTAAPKGMTLPLGRWSGTGCSLKTCVELAGFDSWPSSCPLQ